MGLNSTSRLEPKEAGSNDTILLSRSVLACCRLVWRSDQSVVRVELGQAQAEDGRAETCADWRAQTAHFVRRGRRVAARADEESAVHDRRIGAELAESVKTTRSAVWIFFRARA